jgi:hypothetical protein
VEEAAIELAKQILNAEHPEAVYDDIATHKPDSNAPLWYVYFIHGTNYYEVCVSPSFK